MTTCYNRTSLRRYVGLPRLFLSLPFIDAHVRYDLVLFPYAMQSGLVPMYDMIWRCSLVRYDLAVLSGLDLYDINL